MTLLVATPIRAAELWAAQVTLGYAESVRALSHEMPIKTVVTYALDVVRARNRVAGIVLGNADFADVTNILWWDDDQWPEDRSIVGKMLALDLPVVGAAYTNKKRPVRFVHQPWPSDTVVYGNGPEPLAGGPRKLDERGCLDVRAVGFGFTLTSRGCLQAMAYKAKWYRDFPNETQCPNLFGQLYDYPHPSDTDEEALLSEDFSFCKRWREDHGGKVMLYGGGLISHAGPHAWNASELRGLG